MVLFNEYGEIEAQETAPNAVFPERELAPQLQNLWEQLTPQAQNPPAETETEQPEAEDPSTFGALVISGCIVLFLLSLCRFFL